jgi:hypothetical protein
MKKSFPAFDAGAAGAAMEKTALVAGPGAGVVDFEFGSATDDGCFIHRYKRAQEFDVGVSTGIDRLCHGIEKGFPAIGIDGVVAGMGRNGYGFGADAFGIACGERKKNAVPKGDDGLFHRQLFVMAIWDFTSGFQEVGFKSFSQKGEWNDLILNPQASALVGGAGKFSGVMFCSVIETEGGHNLFGGGHVMENGYGVEATRQKNNNFHGKKGLWASS